MSKDKIETCIDNLKRLKAEIEWEHSLEYQLDLDLAIEVLTSAKRYAHWIRKMGGYECSNCGAEAFIDNETPANYCIECGCRMDGDVE